MEITLVIFFLFSLFVLYVIWKNCKRITSVDDLPTIDDLPLYDKHLSGKVISVCDGDGFKFLHTPRIMLRSPDYTSEDLLTVRLAGIDAPELANLKSGKCAQPFALEAKRKLEKLILNKEVEIKLLKKDRYNRLLAMCFVSGFFFKTNVNMKMVELGMACVYKGKDAVYDDCENEFIEKEAIARKNKRGIWSQDNYISPTDFKRL